MMVIWWPLNGGSQLWVTYHWASPSWPPPYWVRLKQATGNSYPCMPAVSSALPELTIPFASRQAPQLCPDPLEIARVFPGSSWEVELNGYPTPRLTPTADPIAGRLVHQWPCPDLPCLPIVFKKAGVLERLPIPQPSVFYILSSCSVFPPLYPVHPYRPFVTLCPAAPLP